MRIGTKVTGYLTEEETGPKGRFTKVSMKFKCQ